MGFLGGNCAVSVGNLGGECPPTGKMAGLQSEVWIFGKKDISALPRATDKTVIGLELKPGRAGIKAMHHANERNNFISALALSEGGQSLRDNTVTLSTFIETQVQKNSFDYITEVSQLIVVTLNNNGKFEIVGIGEGPGIRAGDGTQYKTGDAITSDNSTAIVLVGKTEKTPPYFWPSTLTTKEQVIEYLDALVEDLPQIDDITPSSGAIGASLTLTGLNLYGATAVTFGVTAATPVSVSDTSITVLVPTGLSAGAVNVTVTTPSGISEAYSFTVTA